MGGIVELSFLFLIVGAKGFTAAGLPFSTKTRLRGPRGRAVGAACLLLGLSGIAFAWWAGDAAGRQRLETLIQGILLGFAGAGLILYRAGESSDSDASGTALASSP